MADVQIDDGIIKILSLEVQDPKAAAVLAEYPQTRWAEITRKALKIGLGYLKGGERAYRQDAEKARQLVLFIWSVWSV